MFQLYSLFSSMSNQYNINLGTGRYKKFMHFVKWQRIYGKNSEDHKTIEKSLLLGLTDYQKHDLMNISPGSITQSENASRMSAPYQSCQRLKTQLRDHPVKTLEKIAKVLGKRLEIRLIWGNISMCVLTNTRVSCYYTLQQRYKYNFPNRWIPQR